MRVTPRDGTDFPCARLAGEGLGIYPYTDGEPSCAEGWLVNWTKLT